MRLHSDDGPAALQRCQLPDADHWLQALQAETCWQSETIRLFGRPVSVPRQVAWFGDPGICYRYSGIDHEAEGWTTATRQLRDWLADRYQMPFNFVLLNHYRDGQDYMGWHADDERGLLGDVCSISLGATRRLLLEPGSGQRIGVELPHGCVIRIPRRWRHTLAKTAKTVAPRINLSYRQVVVPG